MNVSPSSFENDFWTVNFGMKQTQKLKVYSIYQSELKLYKFITRKIHTQRSTHSPRMNSLMNLLSHSQNKEPQFMIASKV